MSEPVKPEMDIELTSTITFKRRVRKDWYPAQFSLDDVVNLDTKDLHAHMEEYFYNADDVKITTGAKSLT